ncbi:MAG: RHS repeat-associated core domain-containing protein [Polyangiaceae bacterium]|nr:RHS repeat-associated core domain-containing protein [Polyangiaceae bacterium]
MTKARRPQRVGATNPAQTREGVRRVRVEKAASGQESKVVFIDQWSEVRDGKLERYIVHADKRVAKLAAGNGAAAGAPTGIAGLKGGNTAGDAAGGKTGALARFGSWFAQVAATGCLFLAPLLLVVLGWHYRRRLVWPARLALGALALLVVSACSSDSPKTAVPGGSVQVLTAEDTLIFSDPLGSVLVETSGNGEVRGRFASYPYGVSRYDTSSEISKYATGIRDKSASLDQMGARFYSHQLGFWISGDPVAVDEPELYLGAEFGAANPYAYANLTPMVARDSSGEFWQILVGAGIGAVVGGGLEAFRQYSETGHITDLGRIGAATAGGAVGGALATVCPQAGLAMVLVRAGGSIIGGLAERGIASGGKDFGTATDVVVDGTIGMLGPNGAKAGRGLSKVVKAPAPQVKSATVLSSEAAWKAQYRASRGVKPGAQATEGIYEFIGRSGKKYVGQSGNIPKRLEQHARSGKLPEGAQVTSTEVLGGKTAREIAEQKRIDALGGVSELENKVNPIGPARKNLLKEGN